MDFSLIVMWLGFFLASYSVVGNDVIQTLGTFLTSNENRLRWYVLWLYGAGILIAALVYGYFYTDISYGRLEKFRETIAVLDYKWFYLLPPIILLTITRFGIPVSTTFMILTLFSLENVPADIGALFGSVFDTSSTLGGMVQKSLLGYIIAFGAAIVIYLAITRLTEKYFLDNPITKRGSQFWTAAQWLTTGFLWFQWLTQDLANIYVYLRGGYEMSILEFLLSLLILTGLLAYIFYNKGGKVQDVVRSKTNTADIRSATFIDLIYGIVLYVFKDDYFGLWGGKLPMSTTWVFVGLLAGRELAMRIRLEGKITQPVLRNVVGDALKIMLGLVISVLLVFIIKLLS
ncbi:MAG TPA: hypothetical protein PKA00_00540 [Saprospiraceae bacterium]|nr:hypothetical protein [Saprospiraceae bacterium]HMQ81352.1 hypothetical protein [Saprospiraceae bacterium]